MQRQSVISRVYGALVNRIHTYFPKWMRTRTQSVTEHLPPLPPPNPLTVYNRAATATIENDNEEERRYRSAMDSYIYIDPQSATERKKAQDDDYMEMMPVKAHPMAVPVAEADRGDNDSYTNTPSCSSGYMTSTPSPTTSGFPLSFQRYSRSRPQSDTSSRLFTPLAECDESMATGDKRVHTSNEVNVTTVQPLNSIDEVCTSNHVDMFRKNRLRELRFLMDTKKETTVIICAHDNSTVSLVERQSVVYTLPTVRAETSLQMRQLLVAHVRRSQRAISGLIVLANQYNERLCESCVQYKSPDELSDPPVCSVYGCMMEVAVSCTGINYCPFHMPEDVSEIPYTLFRAERIITPRFYLCSSDGDMLRFVDFRDSRSSDGITFNQVCGKFLGVRDWVTWSNLTICELHDYFEECSLLHPSNTLECFMCVISSINSAYGV